MIRLLQKNCISCGLCALDCTTEAITFNGTPVLSNPENCIGCGHCIAVCPAADITDDALPCDDVCPAAFRINSDDLLTAMRSRRSCRHYLKKDVPEKTVEFLLSAARACPTAKNMQGTRYIVVKESIPELLDLAVQALGTIGETQLANAEDPAEIRRARKFILWSDLRKKDPEFDPLFYQAPLLLLFVSPAGAETDAASAAAYTELLAASLGLGTLYSGYFTACASFSSDIKDFLGIKPDETVVRCLVTGWPKLSYSRTAPRKMLQVKRM